MSIIFPITHFDYKNITANLAISSLLQTRVEPIVSFAFSSFLAKRGDDSQKVVFD